MSIFLPSKITSAFFIALLMVAVLVGCSHQKTQRGHLFRGDWAVEYNRTPWIGCPPDSGCDTGDDDENCGFGCLKQDGDGKKRKKFRHHCGLNPECSAKNPCCKTLGCGMWIDPNDSTASVALGGPAKACGLTPFCTPQKPCRLTPNCGKPISVSINPQTLMLANQNGVAGLGGMPGAGLSGRNGIPNGMTQNGAATIRGMNPNTLLSNGMVGSTMPGTAPPGTIMPGSLVSRGIVPGASAINSGGIVAAIGVATPAGTMTPVGVRLPNGVVNNAAVIRACLMTPNCTAAHPCGLTPNCGGAVAVNMVSNNATVLASALQAQGIASGVMQAGNMGMLVNPLTNQPINGLTMAGYSQAGYPPIGYAPTGYAPGYPRYAAGLVQGAEEDEEEEEGEPILPETRSAMPVPRFHPIPSKPAFQRSEGMPSTPKQQRNTAKPTTTAMSDRHEPSEPDMEAALDRAYLEGVAAAMDEVERQLEDKRQVAEREKLKEKILQQAEFVQQQLDIQEAQRMAAIQREQQMRQQSAMQAQAAMELAAVSEPKRLSQSGVSEASPMGQAVVLQQPQRMAGSKPIPQQNQLVVAQASNKPIDNPVQLAGNLRLAENFNENLKKVENWKTSVANGVNGVFSPLLGSNQKSQPHSKPQLSSQTQPASSAKPMVQVAVTPPRLPGKPPVLPIAQNYGLLPDQETDSIMQTQYNASNNPVVR